MKKKANVGRPTKYQAKYCEMLEDHMGGGNSFFSFGAIADCDESTLHRWVDAHEEFRVSKSKGFLRGLKFHEDLAKALMTGNLRRLKSETTKPDGTKIKEYAPTRGDGHTWGITMRAQYRRFGYTNHLEVTGKGGGPIRTKDVSDLTEEEIEAELDQLEKQGI